MMANPEPNSSSFDTSLKNRGQFNHNHYNNNNNNINNNHAMTVPDTTDETSVASASTMGTSASTSSSTFLRKNPERIKSRLERRRLRAAQQKEVRIHVHDNTATSNNNDDNNYNHNTQMSRNHSRPRNEEDTDTSTVITAATAALTEVSSCFDDSFVNDPHDEGGEKDEDSNPSGFFSRAVDFLLPSKTEDPSSSSLSSSPTKSYGSAQGHMIDEHGHVLSDDEDAGYDASFESILSVNSSHSVHISLSNSTASPSGDNGNDIIQNQSSLFPNFHSSSDDTPTNSLLQPNSSDSFSPTKKEENEQLTWKDYHNFVQNAFKEMTLPKPGESIQNQNFLTHAQAPQPSQTNQDPNSNTAENPTSSSTQFDHLSPMARMRLQQQQLQWIQSIGSTESSDSASTAVTRNTTPRTGKQASFESQQQQQKEQEHITEEILNSMGNGCHIQSSEELLQQLGITGMMQNLFNAANNKLSPPRSSAEELEHDPNHDEEEEDEEGSYSEESTYYDDDTTHASTISEGSEDSSLSLYSSKSSKSKSALPLDSDQDDGPEDEVARNVSRTHASSISGSSPSYSLSHRRNGNNNNNMQQSNSFHSKTSNGHPPSIKPSGSHSSTGTRKKSKQIEDSPCDNPRFVERFIEEIVQEGMDLTWHQAQTSQYYQKPKQVTTSIELGKCGHDDSFAEPKLVSKYKRNEMDPSSPSSLQRNPTECMKIDLFDIVSIEKAGVMNFHSYPFAIPGNSFFISLNTGDAILLEAKNPQEQQRIMMGLSQVIARLTYNLIAGDIDVCWDLFACADQLTSEDISPESLTVEELDLWFISKAMNDVTHRLVEKSTLQAKCEDEV